MSGIRSEGRGELGSSARPGRNCQTSFHIEPLEARCLLAGTTAVTLENWQSLIFNDGVSGTLPFEFSRDVATVNQAGVLLEPNEPRFGKETLLSDIGGWTEVMAGLGDAYIFGSGWDHDGKTPLAVLWSSSKKSLTFVRGEEFTIVNEVKLADRDLFGGIVPGYRYVPQTANVYEGLVTIMLQRERLDGFSWVVEGVSFGYTQNYGASFERVEQVGGGYDVPAITGGVSDGMGRVRSWCFANAFPEKSTDDQLGVWFPWADYIQKSGYPKGGQIGLFRARRDAVGEPWVVEPNVLVYETWRDDDSGGFHAHTAGMFVDGMVSFWGDVGYRNRMVRHVAADLENYTATTWTHEEEFHGAWSPSDAKVYCLGNQATSAAPGPRFGEMLVAGDEQVELIMMVERPDELGDEAIITNLLGAFPGFFSGNGYAGHLCQHLQYLHGVGYVATELSTYIPGAYAVFFSPDGEHWSELLNLGPANKYFYGNRLIVHYGDGLSALNLPGSHRQIAPLELSPGGTNLTAAAPLPLAAATSGNLARLVIYENGVYLYEDTRLPLDVQPGGPPPVMPGMPMWEFTATGTNRVMGKWEMAGLPSQSNQLHWLTAWHYSLDGDGICPSFRIGNEPNTEKESQWVANSEWVPSQNSGFPIPASTLAALQQVSLFNGIRPAPRRWLTAIEGLNQGPAPTYPLPPEATGPAEFAQVLLPEASSSWSTGMVFGLSQLSSFSTYFDRMGKGTVHTLASICQTESEHIDITFTCSAENQGVVQIDVYQDSTLSGQLAFPSIYFDREDQIRLLISNSPDEFGATIVVTRNGYGVQSKSLEGGGTTTVVPNAIRLSNADGTVVEPLEWYAIQFSPTQSLTTSEREIIVCSNAMFERLDALPADFNDDGCVDRADLLCWQNGYGISEIPNARSCGDSDGDGDVDGRDFLAWQRLCSPELPAALAMVGEGDDSPAEADSPARADCFFDRTPFGDHPWGVTKVNAREMAHRVLRTFEQSLNRDDTFAAIGRSVEELASYKTSDAQPFRTGRQTRSLDDWSILEDRAIDGWTAFPCNLP